MAKSFLCLLTSKRAAPYAFMYITPGGPSHMFTRMSPFLAFSIRQCHKGYVEREKRKQPQHEYKVVVCFLCWQILLDHHFSWQAPRTAALPWSKGLCDSTKSPQWARQWSEGDVPFGSGLFLPSTAWGKVIITV